MSSTEPMFSIGHGARDTYGDVRFAFDEFGQLVAQFARRLRHGRVESGNQKKNH